MWERDLRKGKTGKLLRREGIFSIFITIMKGH